MRPVSPGNQDGDFFEICLFVRRRGGEDNFMRGENLQIGDWVVLCVGDLRGCFGNGLKGS